jgi:hypothetical protein
LVADYVCICRCSLLVVPFPCNAAAYLQSSSSSREFPCWKLCKTKKTTLFFFVLTSYFRYTLNSSSSIWWQFLICVIIAISVGNLPPYSHNCKFDNW